MPVRSTFFTAVHRAVVGVVYWESVFLGDSQFHATHQLTSTRPSHEYYYRIALCVVWQFASRRGMARVILASCLRHYKPRPGIWYGTMRHRLLCAEVQPVKCRPSMSTSVHRPCSGVLWCEFAAQAAHASRCTSKVLCRSLSSLPAARCCLLAYECLVPVERDKRVQLPRLKCWCSPGEPG